MAANVEIKARVRDLPRLLRAAERLSGSPGRLVAQSDVFFPARRGRLKLRHLPDGHGQLIFYERPDCQGPKVSRYSLLPTRDPARLGAMLSQALGVQGTVKKERRVYVVGQTRLHVDQVEGLGNFVELEVMLQEQQNPQDGKQVAQQLMKELGVLEEDLIPGAYLDLLLAGGEPQQRVLPPL